MVRYTLNEKIIKFLIEDKESHSIREISNKLKVDYKNTFNSINALNPKIYSKNKIGHSNLIKLNILLSQEILSVEIKRTEEFLLEHPKLKLIKEDIEEINYPFIIVLIFGSYVKNKQTNNSDIDICIISDNNNEKEKIIQRLKLFSQKLEIQEFSSKEFISMIEKRKRNLGHEIIKHNIILSGIENYYNLISKWMKDE